MFPFDFGVSVIQFNVYFFEWKDIMLLSNRRETQKQKHMETNSTAVIAAEWMYHPYQFEMYQS